MAINFKKISGLILGDKGITPFGWTLIIIIAVAWWAVRVLSTSHEKKLNAKKTEETQIVNPEPQRLVQYPASNGGLPGEVPFSNSPPPPPPPAPVQPLIGQPLKLNMPSFGNIVTGKKLLSDEFIPKGTVIYSTLIMDIVSNNQVSPVVSAVVVPVISAHKMLVPVGAKITGKISPGNLRGRVFVNFDTIVFMDEGRQGHELPIKGVGMTYEENESSGRWIVNGAGLKGYLYDDTQSNLFKLAALNGARDFLKTLETYTLTQNSVVNGQTTIANTVQTPQATIQNAGLAAGSSFIDAIAKQYALTLQQQSAYVLVPTARMCAIYLDEAADVTSAAPGKSSNN